MEEHEVKLFSQKQPVSLLKYLCHLDNPWPEYVHGKEFVTMLLNIKLDI
jgi:hypothetical protein